MELIKTATPLAQATARPTPWFTADTPWSAPQPLSALVLRTRADRMRIAHLRDLADFKSEYLLDPGLASMEDRKDDAGVVMALMRGGEAIATIRFIPSGQGLTLTERFWSDLVSDPAILGRDSWEVGRLVMAPEHRRADLLTPLLRLSLMELMRREQVRHMHGSCVMRMTRLYRRFGFQTHALRSQAGLDCALVHAPVEASMRAFHIEAPVTAPAPLEVKSEALLLQ
jgi:predicted GNAT family N-acyltransferase